MSEQKAFSPASNGTATLTATSSSSSAKFAGVAKTNQVVVTNVGTEVVFVEFGEDAATASATSYPVLPNSQVTLTKPIYYEYVAVYAASGSHTVYVTSGEGL